MTRAKDMADFGPSASAGAVLEEFCSPCDELTRLSVVGLVTSAPGCACRC